jgi:hypothetical protein
MRTNAFQLEGDAEIIPLRRAAAPIAVGFVVYVAIFFGAAVLVAGAIHRAGHHQCDDAPSASSER